MGADAPRLLPLLRVPALYLGELYAHAPAEYYCMHGAPHRLMTKAELTDHSRGGQQWWMTLSQEQQEALMRGDPVDVDVAFGKAPRRLVLLTVDAAQYLSLLRRILMTRTFPVFGSADDVLALATSGWVAGEWDEDTYDDPHALAQVSSAVYRMTRLSHAHARVLLNQHLGDQYVPTIGSDAYVYVLNAPPAFVEHSKPGLPDAFLPLYNGELCGFDALVPPKEGGAFALRRIRGPYDARMPVLCYEQYLHWICTMYVCFGTTHVPPVVFDALYRQYYERLAPFGPAELMGAMGKAGWELRLARAGAHATTRGMEEAAMGGRRTWHNDTTGEQYDTLDGLVVHDRARGMLDAALRALQLPGLSHDDVSARRLALGRTMNAPDMAALIRADRQTGSTRAKSSKRAATSIAAAVAALHARLANVRREELPFAPPRGFADLEGCVAGRLPLVMRRFAPALHTAAAAPWVRDPTRCTRERLYVLDAARSAALPSLDAACKEFAKNKTNRKWGQAAMAQAEDVAAAFAAGFEAEFQLEPGADPWPLRHIFLATYVFIRGLYPRDSPGHMLHLQMYDYPEWSPVLSRDMLLHIETVHVSGHRRNACPVLIATQKYPLAATRARDVLCKALTKLRGGGDVLTTRGARQELLTVPRKDDSARVKRARQELGIEGVDEWTENVMATCIELQAAQLGMVQSPVRRDVGDMYRDASMAAVDIEPWEEMYLGELARLGEERSGGAQPAAGTDLCAAALEHWVRLGWEVQAVNPMPGILSFFIEDVFRVRGGFARLMQELAVGELSGDGLTQSGMWVLILSMAMHMDDLATYNYDQLVARTASARAALRRVYRPAQKVPATAVADVCEGLYRDDGTAAGRHAHGFVPWSTHVRAQASARQIKGHMAMIVESVRTAGMEDESGSSDDDDDEGDGGMVLDDESEGESDDDVEVEGEDE